MRNLAAFCPLLLLTLVDCAATTAATPAPVTPCPAREQPQAREAAPIDDQVDTSFLATLSATRNYRLGRPEHVTFTPDGSRVLFLRAESRDPTRALYAIDVQSGQESRVLTASELLEGREETLSVEERARRERMRLSARGIASFELSPDGRTLLVPMSNKLFVQTNNATRALRLTSESAPVDARFSPTSAHIAFARDRDLVVYDLARDQERVIAHSDNAHVTWGQAEFVAQEEMDRMEGYWWSPDGAQLAVQRTDVSALETFHIADPSQPEQASTDFPYPRAGKSNADVRLFIHALRGGRPVEVRWDHEAFPYLANVVWPKSGALTLLVQNRTQTEARLLTVDARSGTTRAILTETDAAWLNIDPGMPRYLPDGSFLWSTEKRGAWQLELHAADGALVREITQPELGYRKTIHVDHEGRFALVQASADPTQAHVIRVSIAEEAQTPQPAVLTRDVPGAHDAIAANRAPIWIDVFESSEGERHTILRSFENDRTVEVRDASEAPPFLPSVSWDRVELDGRQHDAALITPRNFDETKRYPVLVSVYGGPHYSSVGRTRYRYFMQQWFADHGFVVVAIDGRGTPNHGRLWERAISHDVISTPMADQIAVLQALFARHAYLDREHVGIYGWSFGGYFTLHAMTQHGDVFHAGVAGAPVSDWRDYDTHYTERYMGLPMDNEAGYTRTAAQTWAPQLTRPLLIIHGTADDNVYFVHTLKFLDALTRGGRSADFLPLPGQTHMVTEPTLVARYNERMVRFFRRELGSAR